MIAGGLQRLRLAGVKEAEIPDSLKAVEQRITERTALARTAIAEAPIGGDARAALDALAVAATTRTA